MGRLPPVRPGLRGKIESSLSSCWSTATRTIGNCYDWFLTAWHRKRTFRHFHPESYAYKDRKPEETVRLVRRILEASGIRTESEHAFSRHGMVHSYVLRVPDTNIVQQGKGVTEAFGLASAYGEMMERLQNGLRFGRVEFDADTARQYGFAWDPQETVFAKNALPSLPEAFRRAVFDREDTSLFDLWESYRSAEPEYEQLRVFTPFYCPNDRRTHLLPIYFMQLIYGSNGMAAGNSPEEALSQAICEIFERHVMKRIFFEKITPPTVEHSYISKHAPFQSQMLRSLERSGSYRIVVKDCSLGEGLPVVGVVIFMPRSGRYTVRFGASAFWQIALERCLTELFQGLRAGQEPVSVPLNLERSPEGESRHEHWGRMLKYSSGGQFPSELLQSSAAVSHGLDGFLEPGNHSQKEVLSFLWRIVKQRKLDIFIRDVSFSELNAYQVIIPSMSEVKRLGDGEWSAENNCFSRLDVMCNLPKLEEAALRAMARSMERRIAWEGWDERLTVADWVRFPVESDHPWARVDLLFFLGVLYWRLGSWKESHGAFARLLEDRKKRRVQSSTLERALHDAAAQAKRGDDFRQIVSVLEMAYGPGISGLIRTALAHRAEVLSARDNFFLPEGFFASRDGLYRSGIYQNTARVYLAVKRLASEHPGNPACLEALFD